MKNILSFLLLCGLLPACARHPGPARVVTLRAETPYTAALSSPGMEFSAMPPVVQRTVRAEAGATPIRHILKYKRSGEMVYGVYFENPEAFAPLFVGQDGSVLNADSSVAVGGVGIGDTAGVTTGGAANNLTLSDLPPKAVQVIRERAPDAEVANITKEYQGNDVQYTVSFKGNRYPQLRLNAEGSPIDAVPVVHLRH